MNLAHDTALAEVLAIAASLAERGFLRCVGFYDDGTPHYEVTELGRQALGAAQ